jgi:protein-S-isoprenylcysteine O-methyltransferase Ste14
VAPNSFMSRLSILYVALQFAFSAALVLSVEWEAFTLPVAIVFGLGGLVGVFAVLAVRPHRVSIVPEVRAGANLIMVGPYRWIRHPMYSGLALLTLGFVFTEFHWWKLITWLALIVILRLKSGFEERLLVERFPEYATYQTTTKRFLPYIY